MTRKNKERGASDSARAGFSLLGALTAGLLIAVMGGLLAITPVKTDALVFRGNGSSLNFSGILPLDDEPVSEDIVELPM